MSELVFISARTNNPSIPVSHKYSTNEVKAWSCAEERQNAQKSTARCISVKKESENSWKTCLPNTNDTTRTYLRASSSTKPQISTSTRKKAATRRSKTSEWILTTS